MKIFVETHKLITLTDALQHWKYVYANEHVYINWHTKSL